MEAVLSRLPAEPTHVDPPVNIDEIEQDAYDSDDDLVPPSREEPYAILIFGKSGSGLTALGEQVAEKLGLEYICALKLCQEAMKTAASIQSNAQKLVASLIIAGETPNSEHMTALFKEKLQSPFIRFRGYVISLPPGVEPSVVFNGAQAPNRFLRLTASKTELNLRLKGTGVDANTGKSWSRSDFLPLPKPEKPKKYADEIPEDGEEEAEEEEEEEEAKEEEEEEEQLDEDGNPIKKKPKIPNPADLLRRPEDIGGNLEARSRALDVLESALTPLVEKIHPSRRFTVDCSQRQYQTLETTLKYLQPTRLPLRSLPVRTPLPEDMIPPPPEPADPSNPDAPPPEDPGDGDVDAQLQFLLTDGTNELTGPCKLSSFNYYCPVALADGRLVRGKPRYSVRYRGRIFMFESEAAANAFYADPRPYVIGKRQPKPPRLRMAVMGPACSGITSSCRTLAHLYGAVHVNIEEEISNHCSGASGAKDLGDDLNALLKKGQNLTPDILGDTVGLALGIAAMRTRKPVGAAAAAAAAKKAPTSRPGTAESSSTGGGGRPSSRENTGSPTPSTVEGSASVDGGDNISEKDKDNSSVASSRSATALETAVQSGRGTPSTQSSISSSTKTSNVKAEDLSFIIDGWPFESLEPLRKRGICPELIVVLDDTSDPPGSFARDRLNNDALNGRHNIGGWQSRRFKARGAEFPFSKAFEQYSEGIVKFEAQLEEERQANPKALIPKIVHVNSLCGLDELAARIAQESDVFVPRATQLDSLPEEGVSIFGSTGTFCPVRLKRFSSLVPGKEEYQALFRGRVYRFAGDDELQAFLGNAHYFVPSKGLHEPELEPPPARILIQGPRGSGKTALAKQLADKYQLTVLNINNELAPPKKPEKPKAASEEEEEEQPPEEEEEVAADKRVQAFAAKLRDRYGSFGVILEGEPISAILAEALLKHHIFPDILVTFTLSSEVAVQRLYVAPPPIVPPPPPEKKKAGDDEEPVDEEEYVPPTAEELQEQYKELVESMKTGISETNDAMTEGTQAVRDIMEGVGIPVKELKGAAPLRRLQLAAEKTLSKWVVKTARSALFSVPVVVKMRQAEALLANGRKCLSKFGVSCPVKLQDRQRLAVPEKAEIPVISCGGSKVYYLSGKDEVERLCANPLSFICSQSSVPPVASLKILILGPPKSGKSTLAKSLANDFSLKRISAARAIEAAAMEPTYLGDRLRKVLQEGESVPDELAAEAIAGELRRYSRWVVDGFPLTAAQADLLVQQGFWDANFLFKLSVSNEVGLERAKLKFKNRSLYRKEKQPRVDHLEIVKQKQSRWGVEHLDIIATLCKSRHILMDIDAKQSSHHVHNVVHNHLRTAIGHRQAYEWALDKHPAAPLAFMQHWIDIPELDMRRSKLANYCPVTLVTRKELTTCSDLYTFGAQYNGRHYSMCGQVELRRFLIQPSKYICGVALPDVLPRQLTPAECAKVLDISLEYKGYCPVTLADGPASGQPLQSAVVKGKQSFVVEHAKKMYAFQTMQKLERFMKRPDPYLRLKLPTKLPPDEHFVFNPKELPIAGYLEHSVAKVLGDALIALGTKKPVFPYMGTKESAMKFLALYLRANNTDNTPLAKARHLHNFKSFTKCCDMLPRAAEDSEFSAEDMKLIEAVRTGGLNSILKS